MLNDDEDGRLNKIEAGMAVDNIWGKRLCEGNGPPKLLINSSEDYIEWIGRTSSI